MTQEIQAVAPPVNLGLEASISGFEIVVLAAVSGLCLYYLYRSYFGGGGSKCGGCAQKGGCSAASAAKKPKHS